MCNLYDVGPSPDSERFSWEATVRDEVNRRETSYVAPGNPGLVVRLVHDQFEAASMQWGFTRVWSKRQINNARDDKLTGKTWNDSWQNRRCLIPVRQFYEWSGSTRPKTKHAILCEPDYWMWIAGIWEENENPAVGLSYSMITTRANPQMSKIHDRMPAILNPDKAESYLIESNPGALVKPYEGELIFEPGLPELL